MPEGQIFAALNLPGAGPQPSVHSVQWSGDGQLILSTKSTIYILTPDLGINFDDVSILKTERRNLQGDTIDADKNLVLEIGWHKNLIALDKQVQHQWPLASQEWGALSLGSLDVSWRMATASPYDVNDSTIGSGCLLVTMNTNLELALWRANKNHLKEAWSKLQDITSTLHELRLQTKSLPTDDGVSSTQEVLQAQINYISWSPQVDFNVQPNPQLDGSMLALGSRNGSVLLMRYDGSRAMHCDLIISLSNEWVTHLAWGQWISDQPLQATAHLACGAADGSIKIVRIRQWLEISETLHSNTYTIKATAEVLETCASAADGKAITALTWVDQFAHEKPTLFYAKPGLFHLFQVKTSEVVDGQPNPFWAGPVTLKVENLKTSSESSSLSPVSGISRADGEGGQLLLVTLFDGSVHLIRSLCTVPTLREAETQHSEDMTASENSGDPTSLELSRLVRKAFIRTESEHATLADVGRIGGSTDFDGFGTVLWMHERVRPSDFSYAYDARRSNTVVVAQLWDKPFSKELLLERLKRMVDNPIYGIAPMAQLRPVIFRLGQTRIFGVLWNDILQTLYAADAQSMEPAISIATFSEDDGTWKFFRRSLSVHLYGWNPARSLRLRLSVADYCWKMSPDEDIRQRFGAAAQAFLNGIMRHLMTVLLKHAKAALPVLTEMDLPFVARVITQCTAPGGPSDLSTEAVELNNMIRDKFQDASAEKFSLIETCPACQTQITFDNMLNAICPSGHSWPRCSVTTFLLSTPIVRTCISCTRKAFLAPSSLSASGAEAMIPLPASLALPPVASSWIVKELLEATRCCLFCGNRFVRIL